MVHQRDDGAVEAPDQVRRQGSKARPSMRRTASRGVLASRSDTARSAAAGAEARGQLDQADGNAVGRQQLEHAAVVGVAAGGGLDVAGYGKTALVTDGSS